MLPDWEFAEPLWFWGLFLVPLLSVFYVLRLRLRQPTIGLSTLIWVPTDGSVLPALVHWAFALRLLALALLIVALARPQSRNSWQDVKSEGIDIVIAMDISSSMLARDFEPNRMEAGIELAKEFVKQRVNDRIGLVVYAGESFTQCPLTTDHDKLINLFDELKFGLIADGTAIGMGLTTAVNRLKESTAKSKVVILLTDGQNTAGAIPPLTSALVAANYGVKVYTIGVGTKGMAPMPAQDAFGNIVYQMAEVDIDEKTLTEIAETTKGRYFRATDNESLAATYSEIDKMEKTVVEETQYERRSDEYYPIAVAALALLVLEFLLRRVVLKSAVTHV